MSHLFAGRAQMGTSLAFHIVFASIGVGVPVLMLIAVWPYAHDDRRPDGQRLWVTAVYAAGMLRGRCDSYHRKAHGSSDTPTPGPAPGSMTSSSARC